MRKMTMVIGVVALAVCAATAACGDSVGLSESWFVGITNFSLHGTIEWPEPRSLDLLGFWDPSCYQYSSTPLIEPKLQNQVPGSPNTYDTLLFDFHAGLASTTDGAYCEPYATTGSVWSATMSFNWEILCDNPRLDLSVASYDHTWWTAPGGSSHRSGSASFYVSTWDWGAFPPGIGVGFAPVPEPTSLAALLTPISLSGIGLAFRRTGRSGEKRGIR